MVKRDKQNDVVPVWAGGFLFVFWDGGGGVQQRKALFFFYPFFFFSFFQGVGMMKERVSFVVCEKGSVSFCKQKKKKKK